MDNKRTFIIGDIHGCLDMLRGLMDKIDWDPEKDRLIFLGDYIDRGKDSKGVIDYIIGLKKISPNVQCLMGNHEELFMNYINGQDEGSFLYNGGVTTLNSYHYKGNGKIDAEHIEFLKSLLLMIELDDYYIVHAGMKPGVDVKEQTAKDTLWIREPFIFSDYDFGKRIIFGHTPFSSPLIMDNKIGLDTGAVFGNKLTCLEIPAMKFYSIEA
ncbi:MAG: serine/threonine protein phosphatase [Deltaproteobacteria bacterium]|nr:serine/threonine protein phosphatase [Deltaproteobacteria bacterium]